MGAIGQCMVGSPVNNSLAGQKVQCVLPSRLMQVGGVVDEGNVVYVQVGGM